MAVGTVIQRRNIEQCKKANEKSGRAHKAYDNTYQLASAIMDVECDVRQKGKCEQKSEHKTNQVGVVVDHRQQTDSKQHQQDASKPTQGQQGTGQYVPVLNDFYEETGKQTELWTGRTSLQERTTITTLIAV